MNELESQLLEMMDLIEDQFKQINKRLDKIEQDINKPIPVQEPVPTQSDYEEYQRILQGLKKIGEENKKNVNPYDKNWYTTNVSNTTPIEPTKLETITDIKSKGWKDFLR